MNMNFREVEKKWQDRWSKEPDHNAGNSSGKKYYILADMLHPKVPEIHLGHARIFSFADCIARRMRMKGFHVLFPIGWDIFGVYVDQLFFNKKDPKPFIDYNIAGMTNGLTRLGVSIQWSKQLRTDDPAFYKYTQWIITKLFSDTDKNISFIQEAVGVNWCSHCNRALSNAETINSKCVLCNGVVEEKSILHWVVKISDEYKSRLKKHIDTWEITAGTKRELSDWINHFTWRISRQRTYALPMPIARCLKCGYFPIPDQELPVYVNADHERLIFCPTCGHSCHLSNDTLSNWICSSWHWFYFMSEENDDVFSKAKLSYWKNVDVCLGPAAQMTRSLIYSQIITMFLFDKEIVPEQIAFKKRINIGPLVTKDNKKIVMGDTSFDFCVKADEYGVDTIRLALLSIPHNPQSFVMDEQVIIGAKRKIAKIMDYAESVEQKAILKNNDDYFKSAFREIDNLFEKHKMNIAIAKLFEMLNYCVNNGIYAYNILKNILIYFYPIIPHVTEEFNELFFPNDSHLYKLNNIILSSIDF